MPDADEKMGRIWGLHQDAIPSWQKHLLIWAMPVLKAFIRNFTDTSPASVEKAKADVREKMKEASASFLQ